MRSKASGTLLLAALIAQTPAAAGEITTSYLPAFSPMPCGSEPFTDVPVGSGYCPYITQLKKDGLTAGCGNGKYCPSNPVTREQMAVLLERAMRDGPRLPTIFGRFGGYGTQPRTVSGSESLGGIIKQYSQLDVPNGATLVLDQGAGFIAVQGACNIAGTIQVTPLNPGGSSFMGGAGIAGSNGIGSPAAAAAVPYCMGGKGGNGGSVATSGGAGGGASPGGIFPTLISFAGFPTYLLCGGGGGGGGSTTEPNGFGGHGGSGGGVVYLECGDWNFTGTIEAKGSSGEPGSATDGAGGGGGGGVIVVFARRALITAGTMNADGGLDGGVMNNGTAGAAGFTSFGQLEWP
jgi:hypothetical protein